MKRAAGDNKVKSEPASTAALVQLTLNQRVPGSSPGAPTKTLKEEEGFRAGSAKLRPGAPVLCSPGGRKEELSGPGRTGPSGLAVPAAQSGNPPATGRRARGLTR